MKHYDPDDQSKVLKLVPSCDYWPTNNTKKGSLMTCEDSLANTTILLLYSFLQSISHTREKKKIKAKNLYIKNRLKTS